MGPRKQLKKRKHLKNIGFNSKSKGEWTGATQQPYEDITLDIHSSRLTHEEFRNVEISDEGYFYTTDSSGNPVTSVKFLRPKKDETFYDNLLNNCDNSGPENVYSLFHVGKLIEMFNDCVSQHRLHNPTCMHGLDWDADGSERWGLCCAMQLKCRLCHYKSAKYKLYHEVEVETPGRKSRGRKAGGPNMAVQVALQRNGIGNTGLVDIINSINMVAPSMSGLQRAAHKVSTVLEQENKKDMKVRIENLVRLQKKMGQDGMPINAEADATYNNRLNSGAGKTPSQPATQITYLIAENATKQKQIIHTGVYSKLCLCQGDQHSDRCTANLDPQDIPGNEGRYIREGLESLNESGLFIHHMTTDGDSNAINSVETLAQPDSNIEISSLRCSRHLSGSFRRSIKNASFTRGMFIGSSLAEQKRNQARFALDLSARVSAEIYAMNERLKGNPNHLNEKIRISSYLPYTLIGCYIGHEHIDDCTEHSMVCSREKPWKRPFIGSLYQDESVDSPFISPEESDFDTLVSLLLTRFGAPAVKRTFLNSTQNKVEGCNRTIVKVLPKSITFIRQQRGRVAAGIHSVNNGPGASLLQLTKAVGAPIPSRSKVVSQLQQRDKVDHKNKMRQNSDRYKSVRAAKRKKQYQDYDQKKAEESYQKNLVDKNMPKPSTSAVSNSNNIDHEYFKRKRQRQLPNKNK